MMWHGDSPEEIPIREPHPVWTNQKRTVSGYLNQYNRSYVLELHWNNDFLWSHLPCFHSHMKKKDLLEPVWVLSVSDSSQN